MKTPKRDAKLLTAIMTVSGSYAASPEALLLYYYTGRLNYLVSPYESIILLIFNEMMN
jgi:hypothetical protein